VPHFLVDGLLAGVGITIAAKFIPYLYQSAQSTMFGNLPIVAILSAFTFGGFWWGYRQYSQTHPGIPYVLTIVSGIVAALGIQLPMVHIQTIPISLRLPLLSNYHVTVHAMAGMLLFAITLAIVDVVEQVMSNVAIGRLDPQRRRVDTNNSLLAIWIANMIASFFGGMTNLDGLAKSSTNIFAGAITKVSNLFTAITIFIFAVNPRFLEYMPMYVLAVLMLFASGKMILGILKVARAGRYALALALFCCMLVWRVGIFESIVLTMLVHAIVRVMIHRRRKASLIDIVQHFAYKMSQDEPDITY
jgi:MFS superfamily sulfate permease-like transporter